MRTLSKLDGIKIQQDQIRRWKSVLTPAAIEAIEQKAKEMNAKLGRLDSGHVVWRGQCIVEFIRNELMAD